jgi:hypothetical protein
MEGLLGDEEADEAVLKECLVVDPGVSEHCIVRVMS